MITPAIFYYVFLSSSSAVDPVSFVNILTGGPLAILAFFIWAMMFGKLVPKPQVDALLTASNEALNKAEADADFWRDAFLKMADVTESAVKVAEKAA